MLRFVLLLWLLVGCRQPDAETLYQQAELQSQQSRWTEALAVLDRAPRDPKFLLLRAEVLLGQGNRAAAEALLPQEPFSEAALEVQRLMHLGNAARLRGDTAAALTLLRSARSLAGSSAPLLTAVDLRLAIALTRRGDYPAAEAAARRALVYAEQQRLPFVELQASGNLGFVALNAHRYEEAISWFERVRRLSQTPGNEEKALGNLALCYRALGDPDRALALLLRAEPLALAAGQQHDAMVWIGQAGSIHFERGEFPAAIERFRRALEVSQTLGTAFTPAWAHNVAKAYLEQGDTSKAEPFLAQATRLADPGDRALQTSIALTRARLTASETGFAAIAADPANSPADRQEALGRWARLFAGSNRSELAAQKYRELLELGEATRSQLQRDDSRLSYGANVADLYAEYVDFLMQRGETVLALETASAIRGRLLGGAAVRASALQKLSADSGHVILFYSVNRERSWLWTITPAAVGSFSLPGAKTLAPLLDEYRQFIAGLRDPRSSEAPARRKLTELLLRPAAAALAPGARVHLVPDGPLHALNFETLASPHNPDRYWLEDATISLTPSLSLLLAERRRFPGSHALLVGAPETMPEPYQPLPHAREELTAVAAALAPMPIKRLEGSACSRLKLLDQPIASYRYAHFAVHSVTDPVDPLHSALLLTRRDDGSSISAAEIRQLPWRAELVTLSACRSAGARNYGGEGLVGLTWAFLEAGAQNVVAGLWDVNDRSTSRLMSDFYRRLATGRPPAEALREAKLELLRSAGPYAKPYYWAPFVFFTSAKQPPLSGVASSRDRKRPEE